MRKVRVLVVGGAGYIGSHTARQLAASGFEPVVLDDLRTGNRWSVQWGELLLASLEERRSIAAAIETCRPDAVLHFAASAYVGESVQAPAKYYRNNVANSLNLLEAMVDGGVRNIVFSSSCATYGVPVSLPVDERQPRRPVNPYGRSKSMVEDILIDFASAYGLRSVCLRYFNAAGADASGTIGEEHDPETHLIPLTILTAMGRREALTIMGTDYATPDGTAIRDYIHVSDLARAHVLALSYLLDGGTSTALNLGAGHGYSVDEVVRVVERVSGKPVPVHRSARREGDPAALTADASQARTVLGWSPQLSDIDVIVSSAYRWHSSRSGPSRSSSLADPVHTSAARSGPLA